MQEVVAKFSGRRVLVAGDSCRDVWIYGTVHRTSPEAPVPVVLEDYQEETPGMSGLVASMIDSLGGRATLIASSNRPVKTRIMARVPGRGYQPLCRLDTEAVTCINDSEADRLLSDARTALLDGCTAILLCDYAKGACTPYLCRELRKLACQFRVPIAVDPGRGVDWEKCYTGMIVKANEHEWAESGYVYGVQELDSLIITHGAGTVRFRTRDEEGSVSVEPVDGIDPTGCGDQFHSVLGLCLASRIDIRTACELGSVAARMQVQRHGCVPVTATELEAELTEQVTATVAA